MTTQNLAPLSVSADQLLAGLATALGEEPGANEWLVALLIRQPGAAADAGADVEQLVPEAGLRIVQGETGEPLSRDEVATRAGRRAAAEVRNVATEADLAAVLLEAAGDLVAAPEPVQEPATAVAAVPLSFWAEQLLDEAEFAPLTRDEIVARAGARALERGHDAISTDDVAFVIDDAASGPETPPTTAEPATSPVTSRAERPRTFRLFVSSTFRDLEEERNILRERVYPALREFCRARGARFQDVDLRWGVSEEASLDQQAMNICLGEIDRCREVTPRPNFLVLLGNRYGWLALPPQIPEDDFDRIREHVPDESDQELMRTWYRLDENAVPPVYRLRSRIGEWEQAAHWEEVETKLHRILAAAAVEAGFDDERRARYETSATEQEIAAGALEIGAPAGRASCFVRELELGIGDPDPEQAGEEWPIRIFADPDQTRLDALKGKLGELPGRRYRVGWDSERNAPSRDHLEQLAADVQMALEEAIERELAEPHEPPAQAGREPRIRPDEQLDAEGRAHCEFADERVRFFVGREDILGEIERYLESPDRSPLVVHGGGGTGKSALLAEAVRRAQARGSGLVYRFIGATPSSSDRRALLQGICGELLARGYGADAEVPAAYQDLLADFRKRLEAADATQPLTLFVDSLDQLSPSHGARGLAWIPSPLPEHVRLVVSTRPGETLEPLQKREARLLELGPMSRDEGGRLLELWLDDVHRRLGTEQHGAVLDAFEASEGNPLYLRLAFEEARRWLSDEAPEEPAHGVEGIIERNTFARLAHEENHGEVLVSHALGYLAASRHGLAEDELLDLLSADPDVYRWFVLGSYHVPLDLRERLDERLPGQDVDEWIRQIREGERPVAELDDFLSGALARHELRLPVVLWSRLFSDLRPYLAEQSFEDAVLIGFYHRELGDVARARYLGTGVDYHARLARYFQPAQDGDGRQAWAAASRHALSELPYHLAEAEGLGEELFATLTDFRFLEEKAARVGVAEGQLKTYGGVFQLQADFDLALEKLGGGEGTGRWPLIVTAIDLGKGLVVRCPWCNASHPCQEGWLGAEISCPTCDRPLKLNSFYCGRAGLTEGVS